MFVALKSNEPAVLTGLDQALSLPAANNPRPLWGGAIAIPDAASVALFRSELDQAVVPCLG